MLKANNKKKKNPNFQPMFHNPQKKILMKTPTPTPWPTHPKRNKTKDPPKSHHPSIYNPQRKPIIIHLPKENKESSPTFPPFRKSGQSRKGKLSTLFKAIKSPPWSTLFLMFCLVVILRQKCLKVTYPRMCFAYGFS
jgi:hypothetical protein